MCRKVMKVFNSAIDVYPLLQTTGATSSCVNDDNSDAESVDSELDNPLKHAGTYSAEEVVRIMREKLIRLQKLYIDQFQRLRYSIRPV